MLTQLSTQPKVVGAKQVKRALEAGRAVKVFLCDDADPRITQSVAELCAQKGVEQVAGVTMKDLGKACGISVPAAVAALVTG